MTPSRATRDLLVPYLDTSRAAAVDGVARVVKYGLHTPPYDGSSRRSSLQDSWCDAPSFEAASFSHSSTPAHHIPQAQDEMLQGWPDWNSTGTPSIYRRLDTPFTGDVAQDHSPHTPPADSTLHDIKIAPYDIDHPFQINFQPEQSSHNALHNVVDGAGALMTPASWIPNSLASTMPRMPMEGLGRNPMFVQQVPGFRAADIGFDGNVLLQHHGLPVEASTPFPRPITVVPSQLTPLDLICQPMTAESVSPDTTDGSFHSDASPFHSSRTDSFDFSEVQTPIDIYLDQTEDEDFKFNPSGAASNASTSYRRPSRTSPFAIRKRTCRRQRDQSDAWYVHQTNGIEFRCTGPEFDITGSKDYSGLESQKTQVCRYVLPNRKECGTRFRRSEHLKRHELSHIPGAYPCPILGCPQDKGMTRSDNATDHFKKHLAPFEASRRTSQIEWPALRDAITDIYDQKMAGRFTEKLQRWIDAGMPKPAPRKKG